MDYHSVIVNVTMLMLLSDDKINCKRLKDKHFSSLASNMHFKKETNVQ